MTATLISPDPTCQTSLRTSYLGRPRQVVGAIRGQAVRLGIGVGRIQGRRATEMRALPWLVIGGIVGAIAGFVSDFDGSHAIDAVALVPVAPVLGRRRATDVRRGALLSDLTGREREVLGLMAEGWSNFAIGTLIRVRKETVEAHVASIFSKLELRPDTDDHRRVLAVLAYLECDRVPA